MTIVHRALVISFLERYVLIAISLLGNILLARLLTPEEIGIYSVSLAVISIAQVMREFGVGNFIIQEKILTELHIRTAFGFSLLVGGLLFLITCFGASFAGEFYGEPRMVQTLFISSLNFLVMPFCSISLSLLRRDMLFKRLMQVNVISALVGFVVTLSLAYLGFGSNSMAVGAVTVNIVTGFGAWLARSDYRVLVPSFLEWQKVLKFGGQSLISNVVTTIAMDINDLAVGKIIGFSSVALISRAQGLMNLFHRDAMAAVRNVAFPAFSNKYRENGDLEILHTIAVGYISTVAWPFYAFSAFFSLELLRFMFGSQWDLAAPLVPWFCLAGAIAAPSALINALLTAQGRIDIVTKFELIFQPQRALILVIGVVVSQSMKVFAILFAVVFFLGALLQWYMKSKYQLTDYGALGAVLLKSALVTVICMIPPLVLYFYNEVGIMEFNEVSLLIHAGLLCALAWLVSVIYLSHPIAKDPIFNRFILKFRLRRLSLIGLLFGVITIVPNIMDCLIEKILYILGCCTL